MSARPELEIHLGDNLEVLRRFRTGSFDLVYVDPPFNTGSRRSLTRIRAVRDKDGDRTGFQGARYRTVRIGRKSFADSFDDYLAFLEPRILEARRVLAPAGSFFLHVDFREVHYCKVLLDGIFGRESFLNEIIWAYDYGARTTKRWSPKHDNILWYAKDPNRYTYRADAIDRIPYLAPKLVGRAKAARGKTPTDTWWHTIVPTSGRERTGYPTQKPLGILERIVRVHSKPGDRLLDFFAGSGSFGEAAVRNGRQCVLVDRSREAVEIMRSRLSFARPRIIGVTGQSSRSETSTDKTPRIVPGEPRAASTRSSPGSMQRPASLRRFGLHGNRKQGSDARGSPRTGGLGAETRAQSHGR